MDRPSSYDVAVVGGSIAGCTAAMLYARQGRSVALIESRDNPEAYKTLCTHFIQPSATPTIQRLGIAEQIERAGGLRNSVSIWNCWGWIDHPDGAAAPYGYSVCRQKLDPILRTAAASTPGVEFMPGRSAVSLVREQGRVAGVEVRDREGNPLVVRARLVVGADGRHSRVAELAGVGARSIPNRRSGYFAYFEGIEVAGARARMWFLNPEVAYAFPMEDGLTVLAFMFGRKDKLEWFRKDMASNLHRVFERLPDALDLSGARQVSKVIGAVDLPNGWRRRPPPGLAFAGDALVAGDPLWGVGCGWAFQTGEWLVEQTAGVLDSPHQTDQAVTAYRRTTRKKLLAHYLMTSDYSRNRRYNPAEKILFSAAVHDERTARTIHEFGARTIPVSKLVSPVTVGRAMLVNLRSRTPAEQRRSNQAIARAATSPEPPGVRAGSLEVAGIRSPYLEAGPPDSREAVVFVHGNPGSSQDFADLIGKAGKLNRAIAFDMPGFGRAGKPEDFDYTVEGYAAHLAKLIDSAGIRRVHLVLHDFGGPWGLTWAAAHPEHYASVVLMNTGVLLGYSWHYLAKIWQTPVLGELFNASATRPAFKLLLRHGNKGGLPKAFVNRMYNDYDAGTKRAVLKLYRASRELEAPMSLLSAVLKQTPRPALVIWGARDPYLPVEQAMGQAQTFPDAQVVLLERSGHWPFVDDPGAVQDALLPFLSSVGSAQPIRT
ncbi:MAG: alpha/beta fold hydrolase [Actinomycetota bacterium]